MRTLIVDDENAARAYLRDLLANQASIDIVGEASDGLAAIEAINRLAPDLVFLDIQMPVLNGFEVLPYLRHKPLIVFCTAYDRYALKAFEVSALDYLLKPVDPQRLEKSLGKVRDEWDKLERLHDVNPSPEGLRNLVVHKNGAYHLLWLRDIRLFIKEGRYTVAVASGGERWLTDLTIERLAQDIANPLFFQVNRGAIVHREAIQTFAAKSFGAGALQTQFEDEITISRSRLRAFKNWFFAQ